MIKLNFRPESAFASKKAKKYLENKDPKDIKTITIIRHAMIGDFMNIRPFLIGAREFFPNAKITLSVNRSAMYGIPHDLIDATHIMDKEYPNDKTKKTPFLYRLKQAKELPPQDIIFDLTDSSMTLFLTIIAKAKLKIGYSYRPIRRMFYDISILRSDFVLEADSVQHMLNILGYKNSSPLRYGFEAKYPKNITKQIVYFAGASTKHKCWEYSKFTSLIDLMANKYNNYQHIILQGIKEDEKFLEIYEPLQKRPNITLQSPMPLDDVMQFLANSSCVISNDTGIRNMAIAVETPTVGIFFFTGAFRYWPRDGKHSCVFNLEYSSPSVDEVYLATKDLMDTIYGK